MIANVDPARTLRQIFDAEFYPKIGMDQEELQIRIDQFYSEIFPTLKNLTRPRPAAVSFVEWAFAQGYRIAIATNPLFPQSAIYHRMDWAGLPAKEYQFEVVSSYESFHFAKPQPAYFSEVLGRMGWPEGPVLLVGDDLENDISGGRSLGLPTFWIETNDEDLPQMDLVVGRGSIADLRSWLEGCDPAVLEPSFGRYESVLGILRATPAVISGLIEHTDRSLLVYQSIPEEWSLTEIICHLRDTEKEVNLERIQVILAEDDPFLAAQYTDSWADRRRYNEQVFDEALTQFMSARLEVLDIL
jgi:HAD superfamily hydrolase (TIGR01549 family)